MAAGVDPKPLLTYYVRGNLARLVAVTCDDAQKRRGADPAFALWKATALAREGASRRSRAWCGWCGPYCGC